MPASSWGRPLSLGPFGPVFFMYESIWCIRRGEVIPCFFGEEKSQKQRWQAHFRIMTYCFMYGNMYVNQYIQQTIHQEINIAIWQENNMYWYIDTKIVPSITNGKALPGKQPLKSKNLPELHIHDWYNERYPRFDCRGYLSSWIASSNPIPAGEKTPEDSRD